MGYFFWASFYPREENGDLEEYKQTVADCFPDSLLEKDNKYPDEREDLNVSIDQDNGCVYINMPKNIYKADHDFREWLMNIRKNFKVGFLFKGNNSDDAGIVKVYIPTKHTVRFVEERTGHMEPFDGQNKFYAYERYEADRDEERDHFEELESHYGERPYFRWY